MPGLLCLERFAEIPGLAFGLHCRFILGFPLGALDEIGKTKKELQWSLEVDCMLRGCRRTSGVRGWGFRVLRFRV